MRAAGPDEAPEAQALRREEGQQPFAAGGKLSVGAGVGEEQRARREQRGRVRQDVFQLRIRRGGTGGRGGDGTVVRGKSALR